MKYNSLKRIVFLTFFLLISMAGWALEKESFNVDNIGYKSFSKEKRIGTEIYRGQKEIELAVAKGQLKQAPASLIAKRAAKAKASRKKAIAAANDLIGSYQWDYATANDRDADPTAVESKAGSSYVTIEAGTEENTLTISGMFPKTVTATVDLENQQIVIAKGQDAGTSSYGSYSINGIFYNDEEEKWYFCDLIGYVQEDGSVAFPDDIWIARQLTTGEYAGYMLTPYWLPSSTLTPVEPLTPVAVPDGVEKVEYNMSFYDYDSELSYKSVLVAVDGDDVYFGGLSDYIPEAWIKGTKEENTITFPADQYLGEYGSNGSSFMPYSNDAVFTYNPEDESYTLEDTFFGVLADSYYDGYFTNPVLTKVVEKAAFPAQPTISGIEETNYGDVVLFNVPAIDVDGEKLAASKLSYQFFYRDGDVESAVVFTPADFTRITEDMTEIPFGFTENYDFSSNMIHLNMEHSTWSFIGIQSIYLGGDVENKSEIFWYDLKSAIIEFADANVKASCIPLTIDAEVYIYNVGTGKYISKGEAWGSQAIVSDKPMLYKVQHPEGLADGVYVLYSDETGRDKKIMARVNSDGQVGVGNRASFVDLENPGSTAERAQILIEEVAGGYYTIKPAADAPEEMDPNWCYGVNTAHASNQAKDGVTWGIWYDCTRADDGDNCLWAFVSAILLKSSILKQTLDEAKAMGINVEEEQTVYDDRDNKTVEELAVATKSVENKIALTNADGDNPFNFAELFLADPSFNATNKTGWTSTFTMQCNMTFKSFANDSESSLIGTVSKGGEYNHFPFMEFWNSTSGIGTKAVGKVYFVADGLPAGIYKFSMMAYVNNLNEDNATNPTQFVYFGDKKYPLTKSGMHAYGEFFELTEPMTNVEIGFAQTEYQKCNWFGIDEVQLSYFANDLNAYLIEARKLLPEDWENWEEDYAGQYAKQYFEALREVHNMINAATTVEEARTAYYAAVNAVAAFNKNVELVTKLMEDIGVYENNHTALNESRHGDPSEDPCDALLNTAYTWLDAIDSDDQNSMLAVTNEGLEQWFIDWEREFKECTYFALRENIVPGEEGNCNILLKNSDFRGDMHLNQMSLQRGGWLGNYGESRSIEFFNQFPLVIEAWNTNFNIYQDIELPVDGAYTLHTHGFYRCGNTDVAWQRWQAAGNQETQNLTGANSENTCRAYLYADNLTERFGNEFRNIFTRAQVEAMAAAYYTQDFMDTYVKKADGTYYEKSGGGNLDEDFETCINANRTNPYDFSFNQIATADQVLNNSNLPALVPNAVYGAYAVFSSPEYADDYNMAINFLGRKGQVVKVGVKAENIQDYGWTIFQPFKLTWYGNDVARLQTVMQKVLDNAAALAAEPMQKDTLAALNAGLTAAQQAIASQNGDALLAAYDAINAAYGPAEQSANAYVPLVNKKAELDAAIVAYPNAQPEHMAVATALQSEVAGIIAGGTITSDQIPAKIEEMIVAIRNIDTTIITFADENVKALCVANWDINGDGELNIAEAAAVTDLGGVFQNNKTITSFDELLYFTGLKSIGSYAFSGCTALTSIEIPNSVTSIGEFAFYGCSGLTSISIPNSVTSIGERTFSSCHALTSVTIPNSVTRIGFAAFSSCDALTSVTIPNSVTNISSSAFYNCSGLTSIFVDEANSVYKSENGVLMSKEGTILLTYPMGKTETAYTIPNSVSSIARLAFYGCSCLMSITIPNSVTYIGQDAFEYCSGLTSISIPNSVTNIGADAFCGCDALTSVTIPNSVTNIGLRAFYDCDALTSVTIPNSVTSIGSNAFDNCSALSMVTVEWEAPLAINYGTFSNLRNATLYVPKGSKAAYEAADYWKEFNAIKEYPNGDVNQDGEVDVVDVVDIARFVVGTPSESFEVFLADLNNDKDVNIADAVVLVNEIAGDVNFARAMAPSSMDAEESLILTQQADNSLSLVLTNEREYTAFQFDLFVPADADVEQMLLNTQRKQRHQLLYNKVEEGHYRVTALSTSNRTFKGNDGELLSIMLNNVTSDIAVRNILFIDAMGNNYLFDDISLGEGKTTGIDEGLRIKDESLRSSWYTLDGQKLNGKPAKRGIYIINGKKVVIK